VEVQFLEVMKIDNVNSRIAVDEFLELVANISELRHPNVLELVGYCAEFGQRLLVYTHFSRKTLQDVLHDDDDVTRRSLSWNARIKIALGAAKALE
jgi:Protein tyrosine and serine/threonine kinase